MTKDGLIIAFFPCIYFCEANTRLFRFEDMTHKTHTHKMAVADMINRSRKRQYFWELAIKMFFVCDIRGLRLIMENPYSTIHYLQQYFPYRPKLIDKDRSLRGDKFKKPTQYWYINCEPTHGKSYQNDKEKKTINKSKRSSKAGLCSEERSLISPDYARNFICDFIIGKEQNHTMRSLFQDL